MSNDTVGQASEGTRKNLERARTYSEAQLCRLQTLLESMELPSAITSVGVSGSLARLEAFEDSDCDLLIVSADESDDACRAVETIYTTLADHGFTVPKPGGVFRSPCFVRKLLNPQARGIVDDSPTVFGQRIQILLDARPVVHAEAFRQLQRHVLNWYAESDRCEPWHPPGGFCFELLWQDIFRYWHSIRARAIGCFCDDQSIHQEVNLKLRSSRLLMVAAMLAVLAEARHQCRDSRFDAADGISACRCAADIIPLLRLTPVERLAASVREPASRHWQSILEALDAVVGWLHQSGRPDCQPMEPDRAGSRNQPPWTAVTQLETGVRRMWMELARVWSSDEGIEFL